MVVVGGQLSCFSTLDELCSLGIRSPESRQGQVQSLEFPPAF